MKELLKKHFLKYSTDDKFEHYWNAKRESFWNCSVEEWIDLLKKSEFKEEEIIKMLKKDIDRIFTGEIMGA